MNKADLNRIRELLEHYDEKLRAKAETIADMMADWADCSQSETKRYADQYQIIRIERQRARDSILQIEIEVSKE